MNDEQPQDPGSTTLRMADRLDRACDRFEAAWRAGERPAVEDYLGEAAGAERSALLFELIAADLEWRRRRGERPDPADYLARFPGHADGLAAAFREAETQEFPSPSPAWAGTPPPAGAATGANPRFQILRPHARGG